MKKMKLRKYVLPTIYVLIILVTFLSVSLINNHLLKNVTNYNYSKSIMKDVTENVLSEILPDKFERPYLSENVKLTIVSDGKTINFNNKELLEQYRQAINKQKNPKKQVSDVQARGAETHSNRIFDD